jgi:hypothetical protein
MLGQLLSDDHARLDALLRQCLDAAEIPGDAYEEFRRGLLWHIGVEERLLFPELRKLEGGAALERQLHRDHAALAALLVPPPSHAELAQIAAILLEHNVLEEEPGGLYEMVESDALAARIREVPPVRLAPHSDTPLLRETIAQLLRERRR